MRVISAPVDGSVSARLNPTARSRVRALGRAARRYPFGTLGALVIVTVVLIAILAPLIAPYSPTKVGTGPALTGPDSGHLLGTDQLGRDLWSRLLFGSRVSVWVGILAVGVAASVGVPIGLLAGFRGGVIDALLMRLVDAVIAFPALILALGMVAVFGSGLEVVMAAIGISIMPQYARIIRAQVMAVRSSDYVQAARSTGAGDSRIIIRHIAPNVWAPVLVVATLGLASAVVAEASLSFLGLGVKPPTPTWGNMLLDGFGQMQERPAMAIAPGFAIFVLVLSFNFLGDALRDALDPRLRGTR
jgi:ABC-type dipeptide/oligopeptide/nickel transport system permease subunit